ncbi:autotransporter domain-containing protein [Methylocaldum sp.]|uniref:autotransporter domain-containing protein n=1 Tax=Methylocaldum sp. TaxID=1969727 RepID=UPI002D2A98FE|nr:autotransporter domain-containing protein [Methylocaldum sp.]HYE36089.1 autotransporter domain-containing protein [Methylocaldum sp.]
MRCAVRSLQSALLATWCLAGAAQARTIPIPGGEALPALKMHVFHAAPGEPATERASDARVVSVEREGAKPLEMRVFSGPSAAPVRHRADAEPEIAGEIPKKPDSKRQYEFDYSLSSGYRRDRLNWNIASLTGNPNVLSELEWTDIRSAQLAGQAEITTPRGWHFDGKLGYAWVVDGDNQDSDFLGNDRTLEFSRSNNKADKGHMLDASLGVGHSFFIPMGNDPNRLSIIPMAGYSYQEQNLRIQDGRQTISAYGFPVPLGPFDGLDSSYDTRWHGPWLGLKFRARLLPGLRLSLWSEYHWADFHAEADWNPRQDFQHPKSFSHDADGEGVRAGGSIDYAITPRLSLGVRGDYQNWNTDDGKDKTFFVDGAAVTTRLNEVQWEAFSASIGLTYRY